METFLLSFVPLTIGNGTDPGECRSITLFLLFILNPLLPSFSSRVSRATFPAERVDILVAKCFQIRSTIEKDE